MQRYFERTMAIIEKFNDLAKNDFYNCSDAELDFTNNLDFEMAKALIADWDKSVIRISKMILAHYDINDIKIKFE